MEAVLRFRAARSYSAKETAEYKSLRIWEYQYEEKLCVPSRVCPIKEYGHVRTGDEYQGSALLFRAEEPLEQLVSVVFKPLPGCSENLWLSHCRQVCIDGSHHFLRNCRMVAFQMLRETDHRV